MSKNKTNGAKKSSNAEKAAPHVKIRLGGKDRVLKYNLYSFCRLDEECGVNILEGQFLRGLSPRKLVGLLLARLITYEPDLTIDDLAKTVDLQEIVQLPELVDEAFMRAMPQEEKKRTSKSKATSQLSID